MPRWRPLAEELDPQIREFTSQLRRLVDRSGLSVATIADRTGYSKSSWERYLNGRLLPPRGATRALAEVTGTDVRHLGTMWELAERAWSRSEMRHDVTMEAIRVAQARAALGEFGEEPAKGKKWRSKNKGRAKEEAEAKNAGNPADGAQQDAHGQKQGSGSAAPAQAAAGPAAPPMDDSTAVLRPRAYLDQGGGGAGAGVGVGAAAGKTAGKSAKPQAPSAYPGGEQRVDVSSWGANQDAGRRQAAPNVSHDDGHTMSTDASRPGPGAGGGGGAGTGAGAATGAGFGAAPGQPVPASQDGAASGSSGKRRVTMFLAGVVGALVVIAAAVLLFDLTGDKGTAASPPPSPSARDSKLPAGVKCQGADCTGKDPENMGCGGQHAKTVSSAYVGRSFVEVRYSKVCGASWARITGAAQNDSLKVTSAGRSQSEKVSTTTDAYTPMVASKTVNSARACAVLTVGRSGCTEPGTTSPSPPGSASAQ